MLDPDRINAILGADPDYYAKDAISYECVGRLIPSTAELLDRALAGAGCVLDVGCGRADTLRRNASVMKLGVGIDDDRQRIALARHELARERIGNISLVQCAAGVLPFTNEAFDIVFSERGPLACCDATLLEAVRVLRAGGVLFIETLGERNHIEVRRVFDPDFHCPGATCLSNLAQEESRFARLDLQVQMLASHIDTLRFIDFYDWLAYQCSVWHYLGSAVPTDLDLFDRFKSENSDGDGRIAITYHTIWLAGTKPCGT
jgi:SAM-dependent methyltransferase